MSDHCEARYQAQDNSEHCTHAAPTPEDPAVTVCCWCGDCFLDSDYTTEHGPLNPTRALRVGFTGSRMGVTEAQRVMLLTVVELLLFSRGRLEVSHGGCVGADNAFHTIALSRASAINIHPASDVDPRWCVHFRPDITSVVTVHPPKPALERNTDIANWCEVLLACPDAPEHTRSGTWSTVRRARKAKRDIFTIMPSGSVVRV